MSTWPKQLTNLAEKAFIFAFTAYILNFILFLDNFLIIFNDSSVLKITDNFYSNTATWILFVFTYFLICSVIFPTIRFFISWGIGFININSSKTDYKNTTSLYELLEQAANENNSVKLAIYNQHKEENKKAERVKEVYFSLLVMLIVNLAFYNKGIIGVIFDHNTALGNIGLYFIVLFILFMLTLSLRYEENGRIYLKLNRKSKPIT